MVSGIAMLARIKLWRAAIHPRSGAGVFVASILAAVMVMSAIAISLWQYRLEVEARALLTGRAIVAGVEAQLRSQFDGYDAALRLVIANFADPTLRMLDDDIWRLLLSNIQKSDPGILSITIVNPGGRILAQQGASPAPDYTEVPFFKAHKASASLGLIIGDPSVGPQGHQTIILSRRMVRSDGAFGGIVALVIDLAAIRDAVVPIPIGPLDSMTIISGSGRIIARKPAISVNNDAGVDISRSPNFLRMQQEGQGSFVSRSSLDGVERMLTFGKVDGTNLLVVAGLATESLYGNWRRQASLIGGLALAVSLALIGAAFLLARESRLRTAAQNELEKQARTDFLTGLANRRQFEASLERAWRRSARTGASVAVMLLDADHFKRLNDQHGHPVGDEMLKLIADVLNRCARRPDDLPARIGGEEFAIILADTTCEGAIVVAERIRSALREQTLPAHGGVPAVTVSIGIAATEGRSVNSATDLLSNADEALYAAKRNGRDQVKVHG